MNKLFLIILVLSIICNIKATPDESEKTIIHFQSEVMNTLTPKLAYYYGSKVLLLDSLTIYEKGKLSYSGYLHSGIYVLAFSDSEVYEFMINEQKELSIKIVLENKSYQFKIRGDSISVAFDVYNKKMAEILNISDSLKTEILVIENTENQNILKSNLKLYIDSLTQIKEQYANRYKGTFLGNYLQAQLPISTQKKLNGENSSDSLSWLQNLLNYKSHFFSNVDWEDQRLIYTPVMEDKINDYFIKFVKYEPESLTQAIDTILSLSSDIEVNKFLTEWLFRRFAQFKYKAIDEYAYLYLVKNYYLIQKTSWISTDIISILQKEYNTLSPTSVGQVAPNIQLPDKDGQIIDLHEIDSEYTLLFFWDYECNHCRRILQDVVNLVYKYKYLNINVFTVFTGEYLDIWKAYLAKKIPYNWHNTYQTGQLIKPTITYNVSIIPSIYLLDSKKSLLTKNMTVPELDSYFFQIAPKTAN